MYRSTLAASLIAAGIALCAAPRRASAQANFMAPYAQDVLRPGTHGGWFTASLGFTYLPAAGNALFMVNESVGGRFNRTAEGPGLSAEFQEFFGPNGMFVFTPSVRFSWAIQLSPRHGMYLTPFAQTGFDFVASQGALTLGWDTQSGVEFQMVLGDRGMVFVRPAAVQLVVGGDGFGGVGVVGAYMAAVGGGLIF